MFQIKVTALYGNAGGPYREECKVKKVKISLFQAVEAHRVARG
jgi:hypothetical protein